MKKIMWSLFFIFLFTPVLSSAWDIQGSTPAKTRPVLWETNCQNLEAGLGDWLSGEWRCTRNAPTENQTLCRLTKSIAEGPDEQKIRNTILRRMGENYPNLLVLTPNNRWAYNMYQISPRYKQKKDKNGGKETCELLFIVTLYGPERDEKIYATREESIDIFFYPLQTPSYSLPGDFEDNSLCSTLSGWTIIHDNRLHEMGKVTEEDLQIDVYPATEKGFSRINVRTGNNKNIAPQELMKYIMPWSEWEKCPDCTGLGVCPQ